MKRIGLTVLALGLVAAGVAQPASSAIKPVATTLYFHGTSTSGNQDVYVDDVPLTMDTKKPTASSDKDILFLGGGVTPNTNCAGGLLPYWSAPLKGTLSGKVTVTFYARSTPGANAVVQIFKDAGAGGCNADNPGSFAEVTVPLKAGATNAEHTAVIEIPGKITVKESFHVEILPGTTAGVLIGPQVSGVGYDSTTSPSSVAFSCTPGAGKKAC